MGVRRRKPERALVRERGSSRFSVQARLSNGSQLRAASREVANNISAVVTKKMPLLPRGGPPGGSKRKAPRFRVAVPVSRFCIATLSSCERNRAVSSSTRRILKGSSHRRGPRRTQGRWDTTPTATPVAVSAGLEYSSISICHVCARFASRKNGGRQEEEVRCASERENSGRRSAYESARARD